MMTARQPTRRVSFHFTYAPLHLGVPSHDLAEEQLRDGFEVCNADIIFESTFEKHTTTPGTSTVSAQGVLASSTVPHLTAKSTKRSVSLKQILLVHEHNERLDRRGRHPRTKNNVPRKEDFPFAY
jgi:hypothetical protein